MKLISEDPDIGKFYQDKKAGISVLEVANVAPTRFCAWEGEPDGYAAAARTPWADSIEEAVGFLDFQQFRCATCGKIRARKPRKKWTDRCKNDAVHNWAPMPGKKKMQPGRKINMWIADSQLQEIEQLCAETGNDRASTIRDLISLGIKFRRHMDKFMGSDA